MYSPCCPPVISNPCTTINTVPCIGGDPCTIQLTGCENIVYSGPTLPCTQIRNCDTVCVAFQKVDEQICDLKDQIIALQQALALCCTTTTTTSTSTSSTTTTTTTILCPSCNFYSITNSTITPVNINYYACGGAYRTAVVSSFSTIYVCACTGTLVVPPLPGVSSANIGACPTTTTTTTLL